MTQEHDRIASDLLATATELTGSRPGKVLDFGCGAGRLVDSLDRLGVEAHGCDIAEYLASDLGVPPDRFATLRFDPYRLPYDDDTFDAVFSTSVLEHAQNTEELLQEIKRVLKPGGISLHVYPGKWYLPSEPHIFVPLVNWFWPRVPRWWLALWAWLGVRNEFQRSAPAADVAADNARFCRNGIIYLSTADYRRVSMKVFGNVAWPMAAYLRRAPGGVAAMWRKLPIFTRAAALLARELRMGIIAQRKF